MPGMRKIPRKVVPVDYMAIVDARGVDLAIHPPSLPQDASPSLTIYERCIQECVLPSIEKVQQMLEMMAHSGIPSVGASAFHDMDLQRAQALAEGTITAFWCLARTNSEEAWESWLRLLDLHKIDLSYALLMAFLIGRYRTAGGERGIRERVWLSEQLELFYRFDDTTQQWRDIDSIAYPLPDASLLAWREHVCPSGSSTQCTCPWGYLCLRCLSYRSVSGKGMPVVLARGGQCPVCWAYERVGRELDVASILNIKEEEMHE